MNRKELQPVLLGALLLYVIGYGAFWMMFMTEWIVNLLFGILGLLFVVLAYILAHSIYTKQELKTGLSKLTLGVGSILGVFLILLPFVQFTPETLGRFFLLQLMNLQVAWYALRHILDVKKQHQKASPEQNVQNQPSNPLPSAPQRSGSPQPTAKSQIHPAYQARLDAMNEQLHSLESCQSQMQEFLNQFFAGSTISKNRYASALDHTARALRANHQSALQAAGLFGPAEPTQERIQIMDQYLEASTILMNKVDRVVDELIQVQQHQAQENKDILESCLNDLADTTLYFEKSMQTSSF